MNTERFVDKGELKCSFCVSTRPMEEAHMFLVECMYTEQINIDPQARYRIHLLYVPRSDPSERIFSSNGWVSVFLEIDDAE